MVLGSQMNVIIGELVKIFIACLADVMLRIEVNCLVMGLHIAFLGKADIAALEGTLERLLTGVDPEVAEELALVLHDLQARQVRLSV
jgi:hypothetical protein